MTEQWLSQLEKDLIGRCCEIVRREADWAANLNGGGSISLPVPWRIVANGRIAFTDADDRQKFGLPAPIDGEIEANRHLRNEAITKVEVHPQTADLSIHFGAALRLEAFNYSAGYEGWQINLPPEAGGKWIIALGGGEVAIF